jgi:hypothetical protein
MGFNANDLNVQRLLASGQAVDTTPRRGTPNGLPRPAKRACLAAATVASSWSITLTVPVQVVSEANTREHWAAKYRRADSQRTALIFAWNSAGLSLGHKPNVSGGVRVKWVKLGGKKLDDDNLHNAFKALRDCLAGWLGLDDGNERVSWKYAQEPGGDVGVRVEITTKGSNEDHAA